VIRQRDVHHGDNRGQKYHDNKDTARDDDEQLGEKHQPEARRQECERLHIEYITIERIETCESILGKWSRVSNSREFGHNSE
jgi:hypothetical protein